MNQVFEETEFAGLKLKNRIIRSATFEAMGDKSGRPSAKLAKLYVRLARGGVGAIVTGAVSVQQSGKLAPHSIMLDSKEPIEDLRAMVSAVKEFGTPIIVQLVHAGGQTNRATTGTDLVGPSQKKYAFYSAETRELTEAEIQEIIQAFVKAIQRAQQVGFDGVQLHAAHGYLLSAFLSPRVNKRKDRWGGNTENRVRIIDEIVRTARKEVGTYPILVKFSAYDGDKDGVVLEEGMKIAQLLEKAGIDAIETSCGSADDGFNHMRVSNVPTEALLRLIPRIRDGSPMTRLFYKATMPLIVKRWSPLHNYNVQGAQEIKKQVNVPVIVVGGIRNINDIRNVITEDKADYVSMSRPFIIEPDLVNKFLAGEQEQSKCIDCGYCLFGVADAPLRCYYKKV
jgi:2,4-dienoyl-CoA reductase-like NADH-dependent reductase (Old Yellow Enzyme family)